MIITDGVENQSKFFKHADVKMRIEKYEKLDWIFQFMGHGIDVNALEVGTSYGIINSNCTQMDKDTNGTKNGFNYISHVVSNVRSNNLDYKKCIHANDFNSENEIKEHLRKLNL